MITVPSTVGVIGGGRMGAGIAQVFAQAGAQVTVIERDPAAAGAAAAPPDAFCRAENTCVFLS